VSGDDTGSAAAAGLVRLLAATVEVVADCDALLSDPAVRSARHDAAMALLALGSPSDAETFAESLRALTATANVLTRAAAGSDAVLTDC
jgi:uncharacterized membrane-anchored protein